MPGVQTPLDVLKLAHYSGEKLWIWPYGAKGLGMQQHSLLEGKRALICGVANERSLAWGVAQSFKRAGAQVALTYPNEALEKRVIPLAESIEADWTQELDVTREDHGTRLADKVRTEWGELDIIVHSIAFAEREDLKKPFTETSREGFLKAVEISAFSFVWLAKHLTPLMRPQGSLMAMTYYGSQKVVQNYNVMGVAKAALESSARYMAKDLGEKKIRVNCISAGPVKTLAASGISGFRDLLSQVENRAPLQENIDQTDVGELASFLGSDHSKHITGQVLYVDSGLSILGF